MNSPLILPLTAGAATLALAGGKGENLVCLARAGFPVPDGFIITTHAYNAYVRANGLAGWAEEVAGAVPPDDPDALNLASGRIRAHFAAGAMPSDLSDALAAAYLEQDISSVAVAVRSSATAEDLPGLSFAGQQDTYLNVVGVESLQRAVVNCWSSLWTARAIGYRARNHIEHAGLSMAVIVQAMVQSETSGVLFTANPLTGRRDEVVVEATFGLGEALVGGQVEPDRYVVGRGRILEKTLGSKAVQVRGGPEGGTVTLSAEAASRQALPDHAILDLGALGERVAQFYKTPQDVEWAWAQQKLWLLQSRPITSLYPLPSGISTEPLQVLISFGAVQGVLDPFTPLGQDIVRGFMAGIAALFSRRPAAAAERGFPAAGERLFINLTPALRHRRARAIVRRIPALVEPGVGQVLAGLLDDPALAPTSGRINPRLFRVLAVPLARFAAGLLHPDRARRRVQASVEQYLAACRSRFDAAPGLTGRLALIDDTLQTLPRLLLRRWIPAFAPGMAMLFGALPRLAAGLPRAPEDLLQLTRGMPHNVTTEMDLALWEAAQAIRADPAGSAFLMTMNVQSLAAACLAGRLPAVAQAAVDNFLDRYGVRGVGEIDLGRTRWAEDPTPVIQALRGYLQIPAADHAPDAVFARGAAEATAAARRLEERAARARFGRIRAPLLRWCVRRLRALAGLRETPKFTIVRALGLFRAALLAGGRELVAQNLLDRPEDIFFLRLAELRQLASSSHDAGSLRELVAGRRRLYEHERLRRQVPRVLLSDGRAFYEGITQAGGGASTGSDGARVLIGSPVSPGRAEGRVRVVLDPFTANLQPREILVCPGTDPAWTPLFLVAGGLVMEVGGLMTHGSVVAREYGIPAVVGVTQATSRLRTGQRIRVDGSTGQITILEEL